MKKLFLIIAIAMCNLYPGIAQVLTPNGYGVTATVSTSPMYLNSPDADAAYATWAWNNFGAEYKTELADYSYNCHGYAWTLGNSVFMDEGQVAWFYDVPKGGYVETYDPSDPDIKVVTYGSSHSAIKWGSKYRSKWNTNHQVFEHSNNTPYGTAPTHYYKLAKYNLYFNANGGSGSLPSDKLNVEAGSPASILSSAPTSTPTLTLNGMSILGWATSSHGIPPITSYPYRITSTQTLYALYATGSISGSNTVHYSGEGYTLSSVLPAGGTITWEVSPSNLFTVSPSTGSSTKIMKTSNTNSGQVTLIAKVNGVVVDTELLTAYSVGMSGPSSLYSGGYYSFYVPYAAGVTYSWSGGFIEVASGGDTQVATFYVPYDGSYGYAECTVTNNGVTSYFWLSAPIY